MAEGTPGHGATIENYSVSCRCANCFWKFEAFVPKGTRLESATHGLGLFWREGQFGMRWVRCPKCECLEVGKIERCPST
jgi:hypothetical protein